MKPVMICLALLLPLQVPAVAQEKIEPQNPTEMVLIPGGEFYYGYRAKDENESKYEVRVDSFFLDLHEVTNSQYFEFCEATKHELPEFWGMDEFHCGPDFPDYPVVGVSWWDAQDYAEWAGTRLPTDAEWEYAARGGHLDFKFPWGNEADSTRMNFGSEGSTPAQSYPPNDYGLYEMTGNVWEWVADYYAEEYRDSTMQVNPTGPEDGRYKTIRGGSWHSGPGCVNVVHRNGLSSSWVDFAVGFRCALDAE
ncbi:MAG: SUMF1/EgtB/PvdO family nonheme iron enzyme [bacterium]